MAKNEKKVAAQDDQRKSATVKKHKEVPEIVEATTTTVDRRMSRDRRQGDRRLQNVPVAVERRKIERREKVQRRRQIDPTTCERDYSAEELEFMSALATYKRASGRMFPTCSEILEVLRNLGYQKCMPEAPASEAIVSTAIVPTQALVDTASATLA